MRERLLFATRGGDDCENGFAYVLELSKTLKAGISVLLIYPKSFSERFDDVMTAVTFAEAGEPETAEKVMSQHQGELLESAEQLVESILACCREESIPCSWSVATDEPVSAIRKALRSRPGIEMVLVGPSLIQEKKGIDLKKLLKQVTKPVVTMSRPLRAGA